MKQFVLIDFQMFMIMTRNIKTLKYKWKNIAP